MATKNVVLHVGLVQSILNVVSHVGCTDLSRNIFKMPITSSQCFTDTQIQIPSCNISQKTQKIKAVIASLDDGQLVHYFVLMLSIHQYLSYQPVLLFSYGCYLFLFPDATAAKITRDAP